MPLSISKQQQQHQHHSPQRLKQSSRQQLLFLFRGPVIWLCGISIIVSCSIVLWEFCISSLHASILPLFVVTLFIVVSIFTISCGVVFAIDLYHVMLYPYIIQPAIVGASKYSIDEVLTILCDPTQLAAYISALFVVPVTLYTLPTTPQQRAQILLSTFLQSPDNLNNNDDDINKRIFTEAGGWKYLLPKSIQKIVNDSNNESIVHDSIQFDKGVVEEVEELYHDIGNASTEDEDESSDDDEQIDKDNSMNEPSCIGTDGRGITPMAPSVTLNKSTTSSSSSKQREDTSKDVDVSKLFIKILVDMLDNKFHSVCQRLESHQSAMVLTSITSLTILVLQFRNSTTARRILKSLAHILLTTTSSVAFTGSLLAWMIPYLHQRLVQNQKIRGSNRIRTDDISRWSTTLLSFMQSNFATISKIPKTLPTTMIQKNIQRFLAKWKGTLAVFLLTYFQYRYRKSVQQQQRYNT